MAVERLFVDLLHKAGVKGLGPDAEGGKKGGKGIDRFAQNVDEAGKIEREIVVKGEKPPFFLIGERAGLHQLEQVLGLDGLFPRAEV